MMEKVKINDKKKEVNKFFNEFKTFIARGNVLDLAVGVVVGGAFSKIVSSLVNDIITPLIGIIIGGKDLGVQHYPRFNSPDEIALNLLDIGFNMVSLANNHSLDMNEVGVLNSVNFWRNKNVVVSGQNDSFEDRESKIKVYEQNGIKYAFLAYTDMTNGLTMPAGKDYLVNVYSDEQAKGDIDKVSGGFSLFKTLRTNDGKEINDFCNEHYLVKEENGTVTVYASNTNQNVLTSETATTNLVEMKDKALKALEDYQVAYGNNTYGLVAYILNIVRIYSIPFGFVGIVFAAIYRYVIGIRKLDVQDKGFGVLVAIITVMVICQVLPLIFAIVVRGWRG